MAAPQPLLALADLPPDARATISRHAVAEAPREACGLILQVIHGGNAGEIIVEPVRNVATEPELRFRLDPAAWVAAEMRDDTEVVGIYHSHPAGRAVPSDADKVAAERHQLPYVIHAPLAAEWGVYHPCGFVPPLYGREFSHGTLDCYQFVRDWFQLERGLWLPDFEREDEWWEKPGQNLYLDNFPQHGFAEVPRSEIRPGDLLLMELHKRRVDATRPVPNHAAVYLGDGLMGHHPRQRLSLQQPYVADRGYYARHTVMVIRHSPQ